MYSAVAWSGCPARMSEQMFRAGTYSFRSMCLRALASSFVASADEGGEVEVAVVSALAGGFFNSRVQKSAEYVKFTPMVRGWTRVILFPSVNGMMST